MQDQVLSRVLSNCGALHFCAFCLMSQVQEEELNCARLDWTRVLYKSHRWVDDIETIRKKHAGIERNYANRGGGRGGRDRVHHGIQRVPRPVTLIIIERGQQGDGCTSRWSQYGGLMEFCRSSLQVGFNMKICQCKQWRKKNSKQ